MKLGQPQSTNPINEHLMSGAWTCRRNDSSIEIKLGDNMTMEGEWKWVTH